ncbi:MAG TPA: KH domain-containing protein [Candidatus Thermoplasmatota archaeon]|nr:KH domain-containing protein [Candidatus Thermoplasmatota archaeon]
MDFTVIKIPQNRVGVLIGPEGKTKQEIEDRSNVKIYIDSESGEVTLDESKAFEPIVALKVRDVVRALGRGFSPEHAFRLFQDDMYLEVLDLSDFVGKDKKDMERVRARLIGTNGKTRRTIEEDTGVNMAIFGKTVSVLGEINEVQAAREAVVMILEGAPHSAVYKFLERRRKELRLQELGLE